MGILVCTAFAIVGFYTLEIFSMMSKIPVPGMANCLCAFAGYVLSYYFLFC